MAFSDFITSLENKIAAGDTEEALEELVSGSRNTSPPVYRFALQLIARWESLERDQISGVLSGEHIIQEKNRINRDLLNTLDRLRTQGKPFSLWQKIWDKILQRAISVVISIWALVFLLAYAMTQLATPQSPAEIELQVEKLEFLAGGKGALFNGEPVERLQIQAYGKIHIPIDSLLIDRNFDEVWDETYNIKSTLTVEPDGNGSISLAFVRVGSLTFSEGTLISLETRGAGRFNLGLSKATKIEAEIYIPDTLHFESNGNLSSSLDLLDPIRAKGIYNDRPSNIRVQSKRGLQLGLKMLPPLEIKELSLPVTDSIRFEKIDRTTDEPKMLSSILSGSVKFLDVDREIPLGERSFFEVRSEQELIIQEVKLTEDDIQIRLKGVMREVSSGIDQNNLRSLMPSSLDRLWGANKYLVFLLPILLLLLSIFLLTQKRTKKALMA